MAPKAAKGKVKAKAKAKAKATIGKKQEKAAPGEAKGWKDVQEGKPLTKLALVAVKDRLKAMNKAGNPEPLKKYTSLTTQQERQSFALQLKLDRDASFLTVLESHSVENSSSSGWVQGWLTDAQVAHQEALLNYTTCEDQKQKLEDILDGLPSRPHERPDLAAKGYKQYDYSQKMLNKHQKAHKEKMEIQATAQVDDSKQLEAFKDMITDTNATQTTRGRAAPKPLPEPKEATPKEKAKMEWQKEVRNLRNNIHKDYCTLFNLKVKATNLVSDKESGVTKELLSSINKAVQDMQVQNEVISEVLVVVAGIDAKVFDPKPYTAKVGKATQIHKSHQEMKVKAMRIIGK
jgi:hypothetical protein